MIEVEITEDILDRARDVADSWDYNGSGNDLTSSGNLIGAVGALIVADNYGVDLVDHTEYNMIVDGRKIYVKTKQRRAGPPKGYYEASVNRSAMHVLKPDYFVFVSLRELDTAYIMGGIDVGEFISRSRFLAEGVVDPTNGYKNRKDCFNIAYEKLHGLEVLV
jgi:hypothetical protein|tara:strand:+ start:77 stop:565 length:489 start_codon:yes stop_codon:yes gene_type:complete